MPYSEDFSGMLVLLEIPSLHAMYEQKIISCDVFFFCNIKFRAEFK